MRILTSFLVLFSLVCANAQISLDYKATGFMDRTTLSREGSKLYSYDRNTRNLTIQNLDYTIYKTINAPSKGDGSNNVYLVSDSLFNTDNKIEYILEFWDGNDSIYVLNEDGDLLLKSAGYINGGPDNLIIGETTKLLIRSHDSSWVYQLPGKYEPINSVSNSIQLLEYSDGIISISEGNSVDISSVNTDSQSLSLQNDTLYLTNGGYVYIGKETTGNQNISLDASGLSDVYPNPAIKTLQIHYQLPVTENSATITLINNQGTIENEFQVFENNGNISLDLSTYKSGQYYISLHTSNGYSSMKKAVIVK